MTSFNTKLVLAAIGIAMLASPALAQRPYRQTNQQSQDYSASQSLPEHYPNGAPKTGSAAAQESGADFNLGR